MRVFTHPACLLHDPGYGHPESPARLRVLLDCLRTDPRCLITDADPAPMEALLRVHPDSHLRRLMRVGGSGGGALDHDTIMSPSSWDAALGAAGAALAAVDCAHTGTNAFAAIRPPGHHALADRAMGFCLLGNAVIAARHAQRKGRSRVLIVDWDVHHGNGTQALVEDDPTIRYVSLHQWPWYPGTGAAEERGVGNVFNVPMPAGMPRATYVEALERGVAQASQGWDPDMVLVSAGFDAMAGDPLGGFTLEPDDYVRLTEFLSHRFPDAPMASLLEGGYAPSRVADAARAHIAAL